MKIYKQVLDCSMKMHFSIVLPLVAILLSHHVECATVENGAPWENLDGEMDLQAPPILGNITESTRSICGTDTSKDAVCYKTTEGKAYQLSKAVLRMTSNCCYCTGWLVGDEGHILTNWHCIENRAALATNKFEAMAEGKSCSTKCNRGSACKGYRINKDPVEFITTGGTNCVDGRDCVDDFTLVKLSKKDAQAVKHLGHLKLRRTGPVLGERIFIPQHPAGWGKRIDMDEGGTHVTVHSITNGNVNYKSDTRGGSSGSPIIAYSDGAVIAIHNQGGCRADNGGTNTGVNINRVLEGLKDKLPESAYTSGGSGSGGNPSCKDLKSSCPGWADKGYCKGKYEDYLKKNCKKSCNLCESECVDSKSDCTNWKNQSWFNTWCNKDETHSYFGGITLMAACKKSCGGC